MTYKERLDGRKFDEPRKIEAKVGIIPKADGSAMFKIGNTVAYAAVYGPRNLHPKFMQDPSTGILRCSYNMMPFSSMGSRVRPGGSRRSKEISLVTKKALLPVLDLKDYPNSVVDVFIEFPQTEAGSRCAGICAASMALADAGLAMKDLISAVSVIDATNAITMDLKEEGNSIYLVGKTYDELGGSHYYELLEKIGRNVPKVREAAKKNMESLTTAMKAGLVLSCHDCSEGGLAVAAAEMAFAGNIGMRINTAAIPNEIDKNYKLLFSESNSVAFTIPVA